MKPTKESNLVPVNGNPLETCWLMFNDVFLWKTTDWQNRTTLILAGGGELWNKWRGQGSRVCVTSHVTFSLTAKMLFVTRAFGAHWSMNTATHGVGQYSTEWGRWSPVVTVCTTTQQFYVLPTQYIFLCGSQNKQRLFPYTALTDWLE